MFDDDDDETGFLPFTTITARSSICETSGAGVGFGGRRLRRRMTTLAALLEGIYSQ